MFVASLEQGGNARGDVGGEEVKVASEGVLLRKITQQVTQVEKEIRFLP